MARLKDPSEVEERTAKKLCAIRGLDPGDTVMDGPLDGSGHAVCRRWARWHHIVITEVRPFLEVESAARAVRAEMEEEARRG